jgi:para-aminobenzoate synthetase/4-amino-4-deoxychorismate lyase
VTAPPPTLVDFPAHPADPASARLRLRFDAPLRWHVARCPEDVAAVVEAAHAEAVAGRWCVGWIAYEAAAALDPVFVAEEHVHRPTPGSALAAFAVFDASRPWDVDDRPSHADGGPEQASWIADDWRDIADGTPAAQAEFARRVEHIRARIVDGDVYQVNLTTRLAGTVRGDALAYFRALHRSQPRGYAIHLPHALEGAEACIASVSPELFFHWQDGAVTTQPMKGTAPRGATAEADTAAGERLRTTPKERAENLMIVDLLRNDLSRVAVTGTVSVPRLFELHALPTVWQMTSTVEARTRPGLRLSELCAALFPCGSVTGAPKRAAMAHIRALEEQPRGVYCGALGVMQPGGAVTFNVPIRTVTLRRTGDGRWAARCGVGSGITHDSHPDGEAREWQTKRAFLHRAARPFELLESLRLEDGRYWLLERHLARLARTSAFFGFAMDPARVNRALAALAAKTGQGLHKVRLRVTATGVPLVDARPLEITPSPLRLALAARPMPPADEFIRHKTSRRDAYADFAPAPGSGIFDTLLWNADGDLTETTIGNVALRIDGRWWTPPISAGLLPGVYREALIADGHLTETTLRIEDLECADSVAMMNSVRGWMAAVVKSRAR